MRAKFACMFGLLILVFAITVGCDDDNDNLVAPQVGAITINPEPNSISAPWQITGPNNVTLSAEGDSTLAGVVAGSYTLTWESVEGWTTPSPAAETQTLAANGTLTFTGTYVAQTGTITINPEPNSIGAAWQIAGPNGFTLSADGDTTLADVAAGSYTLTWESVEGWTTPSPAAETQALTLDGVVTFAGQYCPGCFVSIPSGTFMMGSPTNELLRNTDETQHQVTLTHSIYVQTTEVTNLQYMELAQWAYDNGHVTATSASLSDELDGSTQELLELDGADPSYGTCEVSFIAGVFSCINPTHPVKYVTWYGSVAYCDWLSLQQGLPRAYSHATWQCNSGNPYMAVGYRLPTEAEWEYACRAGTQTPFHTGSCLDAGTEANYNGVYPYNECPAGPYVGRTVPVVSYPANAFGLYNVHGNLWERCNDWYVWFSYDGTVTDPVGPGTGSYRVIRGGSWDGAAGLCRSACRGAFLPDRGHGCVGFRPVRSAP